jgi:uncharacterized membrane protein
MNKRNDPKVLAAVATDPRKNSMLVSAVFLLLYFATSKVQFEMLAAVPMFTLAPYYLMKYRKPESSESYQAIRLMNGLWLGTFLLIAAFLALRYFSDI